MDQNGNRPSPESLLAKLHESERARLRVYIGSAPGVGKTYKMLEEAQLLRTQGVDICIGLIESHGRAETEALIDDLERVPLGKIEYRGAIFEEMDVAAIIKRRPALILVDELAHTNIPGSKNHKRYEDVREILDAGISVIAAFNVHISSR
ncbi:MAG TPA: hypothetical protein VGO73_04410 [Pyrinomonadaceae bacterium]|jgi:two-component system sensor histidine kinase KdpD|nr:hypothetical protein [Pyrinomonadaceae bacterium]